ncbi:MAG: phosphotransferase [Desulfamplus sp.]|nr:phosphotransferase [Desulfamplus sp.]
MKALILAAGFGTRLLPHTAIRPKPLFTLNGVPVLQRCIEQLIQAGCTDIIINTHHLHDQIEHFIDVCKSENLFNIPVTTIHEPKILDTGGAIKNVQHFMGNDHFIVVNSDIVSDIDIKMVWEFHLKGNWCATLVLHDYHIYNKVSVNKELFIKSFEGKNINELSIKNVSGKKGFSGKNISENRLLAFTGVQVLSPEIFDHMQKNNNVLRNSKVIKNSNSLKNSDNFQTVPFSSIALYSELARKGNEIKAFICKDIFWQDIGTPETYRDVAIRFAAAEQLTAKVGQLTMDNVSSSLHLKQVVVEKLAGDGSDRRWFRCTRSGNPNISVIVADHGIQTGKNDSKANDNSRNGCHEITIAHKNQEIDSFIKIGKHLYAQGIPVPAIKGYDRFSGLVVLEDLGDVHLQDVISKKNTPEIPQKNGANNSNAILDWYKKVCCLAISFSIQGIKGFDDAWTFQTSSYSKEMILEKECRYFVEAFLQGFLKLEVRFDDFMDDFEFIAEHALEHAFEGLMHRDMQSRNIMVKDGQCFFIDFQSARRGPLEYDLASLLIDPYVNLDDDIKENILHYCAHEIERITGHDTKLFIQCYRYCAITRNMQMLGAFSHLSMNLGKTFFEQFIPLAVENLKQNISNTDIKKTGNLYKQIRSL